MIWQIHQIFLGLHILCAIIWVGGLFFVGWGIFPSIRHMKYTEQREFLLHVMKGSHPLFTIVGLLVILTGISLGTILGPIKHWEDIWGTTYGNLWITALGVASISLIWGVFIGYRSIVKILNKETIWVLADKDIKQPLYQALIWLFFVESVEPLGFVVLIIIMVLL